MRSFSTLLIAALAGGCSGSQSSSPGTGSDGGNSSDGSSGAEGGNGSDAASACAQSHPGSCADCEQCALSGPCASLYMTCKQNADCLAVDQCFSNCAADTTCIQGCYAQHPAGMSAFQAVTRCQYCEQCVCSGICGLI